MQVFYIAPALQFWLIVVSLFFNSSLFSTGFHQFPPFPHVSSSLECLDPLYTGHPRFLTPSSLLWRCYTLWIPPKYPLKFHQNGCWMTSPTAFPILLQPSFHGLVLLDTCSSLLVHLVVVSRGRKQAQVPANI